jgi:hypothetical protein
MQDNPLATTAFYEMPSYTPIASRTIRKQNPPDHVRLDRQLDKYYQEMMSYFSTDTHERVGILEGEYALICDCNLLLARDGSVIRTASAADDVSSSRRINDLCLSEVFLNAAKNILSAWDQIFLMESPAVLSDPYIENYFHFSLEMTPRIRLFPAESRQRIVVGQSALLYPFQKSLLARAGAGCSFIPAPSALRVRNPIVAYDSLSDDGVRWLRKLGPTASRGPRRIYIRRGSSSTRNGGGGGLEETSEILSLLEGLSFEIIEFCKSKTVDDQIAMLDGANIIISAHGAALTNIAYLEEGISILEIVGGNTPRAMYMHICAMLGLNYRGIITDSYTEDGNLRVNAAQLRECILSMG